MFKKLTKAIFIINNPFMQIFKTLNTYVIVKSNNKILKYKWIGFKQTLILNWVIEFEGITFIFSVINKTPRKILFH